MSLCQSCNVERVAWHPGPDFKCAPLEVCPSCHHELPGLAARRDAVRSSSLYPYLLHARLLPFLHQVAGVETLTKWNDPDRGRYIGGTFFIGDEMGAGKTKQIIDTAQCLFLLGDITRVVIMCPSPVRGVWADQEFGELSGHLWESVPSRISEFHIRTKQWEYGPKSDKPLRWIITNYEYVHSVRQNRRIKVSERMSFLMSHCDNKTWVVFDESSALNNPNALQSKAARSLRLKCGRATELNGTPVSNGPGDLFGQCFVLDPNILQCPSFFQFRSRYAVMGGFNNKEIVGWLHPYQDGCCDNPKQHSVHRCQPGEGLDEIRERMAPYVLRRLKKDCLDLPAKLPPVTFSVHLSEKTWQIYKDMRNDMVSYLSGGLVSETSQAITKVMRLSQITSGFLGGVEEDVDFLYTEELPGTLVDPVQEIGREKLDFFLTWLKGMLEADHAFKVLVWCRYRPELERLLRVLPVTFPGMSVGAVWGSQSKDERRASIQLLDPRTSPPGPALVACTPGSGSLGINLSAAHTAFGLSRGYSLKHLLQGDDRLHRPGQVHAVSYYDLVATGPKGQQTIDHLILRELRAKHSLATWTVSAWIQALKKEEAA